MASEKSGLTFSYDKEGDILYVSFGDPVPAYGENLNEDILLRCSLEDGGLVALTVVSFRARGGIDGLLDRLNGFVASLRIPLLTARAEELRETADSEAVPG